MTGIRAGLALALSIASLAACVSPKGSPSNGASFRGATAAPASSTSAERLDLATVPMFVLSTPLGEAATLLVGFADGRVTREVTLEQAVGRWYAYSPMAAGRMAFVVSDVDLTEIHLITASSEEVAISEVQGHPLTLELALAPDGMSVYYLGRERLAPDVPGSTGLGATTGVWRVGLGGDGVPERVLPPATPTNTDAYWSDPNHWRSHLFITPGGSTLVAADCISGGFAPCRIRTVDIANGGIRDLSSDAIGTVIGLSGRSLVGVAASQEMGGLVVLNLDSGLGRQLHEAVPFNQEIQRLAHIGAYIDNDLRQEGRTRLDTIDLGTGLQATVYRNEERAYLPGWSARIEAPSDWIFVVPEGCFPPPPDNFGALVNWRTGELVPLGMEEAPPGPCNG